MGIPVPQMGVQYVYGCWDLKSKTDIMVVFYVVRDQCSVECRVEDLHGCDMVVFALLILQCLVFFSLVFFI